MAVKQSVCLLSFTMVLATATAESPCSNHLNLTFLSERMVGYKLQKDDTPICDFFLVEGWYSMDDAVLADTAEPCGTVFNWYMNGTLPTTENEEESITACKNNPPDECEATASIKAMKCSDGKYVFYLPSTSGCSQAYCIKSIYGSKGSKAPDLSAMAKPNVEAQIDGKELIFYCNFTAPTSRYFYDVIWSLSNGESLTKRIQLFKDIQYEGPTDLKQKTLLKEKKLHDIGIRTLGFSLVCSVKAKAEKIGRYSETKVSDEMFCGVEVSNNGWLTVKNNSEHTVKLRLTVPFVDSIDPVIFIIYNPKIGGKDTCQISQAAIIKNKNEWNACAVKFKNEDVINKTWKELQISSLIGHQLVAIDRVFTVQLVSIPFGQHAIFGNYSIQPINVQVVTNASSLKGFKCFAHSDPHMLTFDNSGHTYENQNEGTFVMYRNTQHNVETQIKTDKCPNYKEYRNGPWCNCGVAIRAGRDVFKIDNCGNPGLVDPKFEICEDGILHGKVLRTKGGKEFRVFLPSGTEVLIQMNWETFLEVDIFPSILDEYNTEGLCGSFDYNIKNDPKESTATNWKVKPNENLFDLQNYLQIKPWREDRYLCTCDFKDQNDLTSQNYHNNAKCDTTKAKKCTYGNIYINKPYASCSSKIGRRKRSAEQIFYDVDKHKSVETNFYSTRNVNLKHVNKHSVKRRSTYTQATARKDCITEMNTTMFQMCSNLPNLDLNPFIDNCVSDALVSNSMEWTYIHNEGLKKQCVYNVEVNQPLSNEVMNDLNTMTKDPEVFTKNISNQTTVTRASTGSPIKSSTTPPKSAHTFAFTPELLENMKSASCPNDCSGHGRCSKGICICDPGYMDIDCSLNENVAPEMIGIPDRGVCDLRNRKCQQTSVFGKYIVETPNLVCKLQPFQYGRNGTVEKQLEITNHASLESFTQVTCQLPYRRNKRSIERLHNDFIARGYHVSLSNNGKTYSEDDIIVIFDSACVNCTKVTGKVICTTSGDYCLNDGNCYQVGDTAGCYTCMRNQPDKVAWIAGPDCPVPSVTTDEGPKLWLIGAIVPPVVVVVIIIAAVIRYKAKRQHRKPIEMGSVNSICKE